MSDAERERGVAAVLSSGEMSRASGLSPKALRLYHSNGLLVPAHIDRFTGYRGYDPEQVDRGRVIALLRRLEMPLSRISEVLDGPDEMMRANVLTWWRQRQRDVAEGEQALRRLNEQLIADGRLAQWPAPVERRNEPDRKLATLVSEVDQSSLVATFTADLLHLRSQLSAQDAGYGDEFWVVYRTVVGPRVPGTIETCVPYSGRVDPAGSMILRAEPAGELAVTAVRARECRYPAILAAFDAVEQDTAGEDTGPPREMYPVPWTDEPDAVVAQVAVPILKAP